MKVLVFLVICSSVLARAQDAATEAMQQAQIAQQQAIQAAQQAQDQATQASQQATTTNLQMQPNSANTWSPACPGPLVGYATTPIFSVKPGKVNAGTVLRIKSETHYATIYYTVDGWTPTTASTRYTGPITLDANTAIQAIAIGPNLLHSAVARADYTVNPPANSAPANSSTGPQPTEPDSTQSQTTEPETPAASGPHVVDGVLRAQTPLRLTTTSTVSSERANVGDKITLQLAEDVMEGDTIVIAKGASVEGVVTIADPAEKRLPGDLAFEVRSLDAKGTAVPLVGGETLEGAAGENPKEALILPGMVVYATVAEDAKIEQ